EEAPAAEPSSPSRPLQLLPLSARTAAALDAAALRLAAALAAHPEAPLADAAWTLATGRRGFERRRAVVAGGAAEAAARLRGNDPRHVIKGARRAAAPGIAFLFPGLGAHYR